MSDTSAQNPKASSGTIKSDAGEKEMQNQFDEANEQGFFGTEVDPTPNENYSLQGGPAGEGTPETDAGAFAKAQKAIAETARAPR